MSKLEKILDGLVMMNALTEKQADAVRDAVDLQSLSDKERSETNASREFWVNLKRTCKSLIKQ